MKKKGKLPAVCAAAFSANFALFLIKLYIGLRTNSISIYSDGVNNLFDSLSGLITLLCMHFMTRKSDVTPEDTVSKLQQLLSFLMSLAVTFTGFYFAYSSLERLMYPTPVWYTPGQLWVLVFTAVAKLIMFAIYKIYLSKEPSPVVKVMAYDSLLDFFTTSATVLTLYISGKGSFAFDAVFGMVISVVIIVSAVKLVFSNAKGLIDFVEPDDRQFITDMLSSADIEVGKIYYTVRFDKVMAFAEVKTEARDKFLSLKSQCMEKTGIYLNFIIK